jgi:hypothetical protein
MATLIRRTLLRTWAPIFKSLSRMVPQVASGELGVLLLLYNGMDASR